MLSKARRALQTGLTLTPRDDLPSGPERRGRPDPRRRQRKTGREVSTQETMLSPVRGALKRPRTEHSHLVTKREKARTHPHTFTSGAPVGPSPSSGRTRARADADPGACPRRGGFPAAGQGQGRPGRWAPPFRTFCG